MDEVFKIMGAGDDKEKKVIFELVELSSTAKDAEVLIKFLGGLPIGTMYHLLLLMKERWPKLIQGLANNQLRILPKK
ncbi:MAG: hypothetical protein A3J67_01805 [Parcubacteria group bacterium RIFCSPHIGHO2_02_FULL_48_10b]|nr:MAG: hypothetical protein A3J67_01805 [Parcubacteria group bacterium RIFCSPHIGHO2_02_FULL_48_10b]